MISFAQAAQKYSEDPGSKERGGQYQINRNEKTWDPAFLNGAFRLKEGEISAPIKGKFGYHIIQMVQRSGDDAVVRHILRVPPVTDVEMAQATARLDSARAKIVAGTLTFATAAGRYSEDEAAKTWYARVKSRPWAAAWMACSIARSALASRAPAGGACAAFAAGV